MYPPQTGTQVPLGEFISDNIESILAEWENFARGIWPGTAMADPVELRDHAEEILRAAVADMASAQTEPERAWKSTGRADNGAQGARMSAASVQHASGRADAGFDVVTIIAEYRALRASVLRLWRDSSPSPNHNDLDDLTRFNETSRSPRLSAATPPVSTAADHCSSLSSGTTCATR